MDKDGKTRLIQNQTVPDSSQAGLRTSEWTLKITSTDCLDQQSRASHHFAIEEYTTHRLMPLINKINKPGSVKLWFAGQGINKAWAMKREMLSPAYTTRVTDLPVAAVK